MRTIFPALSAPSDTMVLLSLLSLSWPLFSFLVLSLWPQRWKYPGAALLGTVFSGMGLMLGIYLFMQVWDGQEVHARWPWFELLLPDGGMDNIQFTVGVWLGNIAVMMILVVQLVAFLVHLFSLGYMRSDPGIKRYYAFLGLFTFSMLGIVMMDNLLLIFCFWELVGFSSYLLIGFWYKKPRAAAAGTKAFLTNRIGDLGFLLGLMVLWAYYGTLDLEVLAMSVGHAPMALGQVGLTVAGIGIFCGVIGKSAQFPLQVWLPDAMEGPTPVSALIHAATMVAAGVFLLARVFPLMDTTVLTFIAFTGALTALMGAVAALHQNDIKKVLAYSTISQLGYMVMGMGIGAYGASLFHLLTHAAFKACLFLSAGAVIHTLHGMGKGLHGEGGLFDIQDMRAMGGLKKYLPFTYITYVVGAFALIGLPFFSGFLSKDALLAGAWSWGKAQGGISFLVPLLAFITVPLTAYYMGRQLLLVFWGHPRRVGLASETNEVWQGDRRLLPWVMKVPMLVLAFCSLGIVFSLNPLRGEGWALRGLQDQYVALGALQVATMGGGPGHPTWISALAVALALFGLGFAYRKFRHYNLPDSPMEKRGQEVFFVRLSRNNWYLDWFYRNTFIRMVFLLARGLRLLETNVLYRVADGFGKVQVSFAHWVSVLNLRVLDRAVDVFAVAHVVLAHIVALWDRAVVDGSVNLAARCTGWAGRRLRRLHGGEVQGYLLWCLTAVMLLIWFFFIL